MSIRYAAAIFLLTLAFGSVVHAGVKPAAGETTKKPMNDEKAPKVVVIGEDSLPVIYKESALVVRNKDGAAAIVFDKPIENGVTYRYRFLANGQNKEQVGEGKVFFRYKKVWSFLFFTYQENEGKPSVEAGPISFNWHYHTRDRGYITYDSAEMRIETTDATDFARIDLKRSLK